MEKQNVACRLSVAFIKGKDVFIDGKEYPDHSSVLDAMADQQLVFSDLKVIKEEGNVLLLETAGC